MKEIRIGLMGISGYAGMEVARILASHPSMRISMAFSRGDEDHSLADMYPFLRGLTGAEIEISKFDLALAKKNCDIVFLATPAGTALELAPQLLAEGMKVVDFSADFRLKDPQCYQDWYKLEHNATELLKEAVYGLPEIYAEQIKSARLVANPGCYPTSVILALRAALQKGLVKTEGIIIDSKSGASGAGRKAVEQNLFCEVADDFRAYGVPTHRHTPEIEQELGKIAKKPVTLLFTPHLVPMKRGILSAIYTELSDQRLSLEEIHEIYCEFWKDQPWIRILPPGKLPRTINVRGSMFCDIGLVKDQRTGRLLILSAIDNLCRGAAGQAVACANLMSSYPVETGLSNLVPIF